jgi:LytS/YehU family sensor histidine kinase
LGEILHFEIENSRGKTMEPIHSKYKGIGIENVQKRLELIYPDLHSLKIQNNEHTFKVLLQVQLK